MLEIFTADSSLSIISGALDLLSIPGLWGCRANMYPAGWFGHEGYFTPENVNNTAKIVASIIGG